MTIPDIPYATALQRIVTSRSNEILFAATAQSWNSYQADNPATLLAEDHVAVEYSTGSVTLPGDAPRTMVFKLAWNLGCPSDIVKVQLDYLTRQLGNYWFGQDMFAVPGVVNNPLMWPLNAHFFADPEAAIARGPFRYFRNIVGDIYAFNEWIPRMNYNPSAP